ncbi:hypothetical protein HJC23_002526 [Cyclotella cryptica]|uniref:Aspartic peptidase DDI1-type domain-containing protein n=1 Tax=Cyclotella cryptica TaxID=29204 RepID=A0ABD3QWA6_9STRA|eukprot:CCRYP_001362-RB/>CCRYP_001362-RB protein AED:0.10 eAED:0.10 QI:721/1/1/1/0.5/0.33/3/512/533
MNRNQRDRKLVSAMANHSKVKMMIRISTILLLPLSTITTQASNTVSISHRSIGTRDYSQGLNVVKNNVQQEEQEYVTSFYKRVQHKVKDREGGIFTSCDATRQGHDLNSNRVSRPPQQHQQEVQRSNPFSLLRKTVSQDAAGVRGGAASSLKMHSIPPVDKYADGNHTGSKKKCRTFKTQSFSRKRELEDEFNCDTDSKYYIHECNHDDNDKYQRENHCDTSSDKGEDDYPPGEHHLGLLRVPCTIAINSGEGGRFRNNDANHENQHVNDLNRWRCDGLDEHYVKKTPIAAYVDTGAQVTVISASAARRAGILHLMDRRYAGRATGVGHCKVLGRIPARHVYFFLGEESQQDSCRGGGVDNSRKSVVQMDGPALTVLEGTVTKGVDILLGLDVLQDWEAEIRMGANKSITVKKKEGGNSRSIGENSVIIPFVNHASGAPRTTERHRRNDKDIYSNTVGNLSRAQQRSHHEFINRKPTQSSNYHNQSHLSVPNSMASQFHRRHHPHDSITKPAWDDEDQFFSLWRQILNQIWTS